MNPAGAGLLGWHPEELRDVEWSILCPEWPAELDAPAWFTVNGVQSSSGRMTCVKKGGARIDLAYAITGIEWEPLAGHALLAFWLPGQNDDADDSSLQEQNYRRLFENAADGIFQSTPDGRYLAANPALARMYGYDTPEDLINAMTDIAGQLYVVPERRQAFLAAMEESGTLSDFELQIRRRDGTIIWISESARAVYDEEGKVMLYEGMVRDVTARKEMEAALRESETTWRCLVENSGDMIFLVDEDGTVVFSNRVQTSDSSHLHATVFDYVSPDSQQALQRVIAGVFESGSARTFELEEIADGMSRWYESRANPIILDGTVNSVLLVCTEITDQKQTEESLRASKRFIERVADSSPHILYVYDLLDDCYIYANHQLSRILGYTLQELLEMGPGFLQMAAHPDDRPILEERNRRLREAEDGAVFEWDLRLKHREGEWRWFRTRDTVFTRTADGQPREVIGIADDITERKLVNLALRESESRYRRLVEGASIVPWERLTPDKFSFVGPQAAKLLGYPVEKWYDEHFFLDHVHPDDRDQIRQTWHGEDPPQRDLALEYRMIAAGNRTIWVRDITHVLKGHEHHDPIWHGFIFDITEAKQATEELKKSRSQLRELSGRIQAAREEERIANSREIHDELGGALTAMKVDLSLIKRHLSDKVDAFTTEKINSIFSLIDTTIQSVRRIASNLRPPVLDAFGIADAIEWQAIEFEKRCGVRCYVENEWGIEVKDSALTTAIFRILQEILTNVARHAHASRVEIAMRERNRALQLIVSDNGRGITEREQTNSLGILGMRERALMFGGTVDIQGVPGRGTTVTLSIPLDEVIKLAAPPAPPEPHQNGHVHSQS